MRVPAFEFRFGNSGASYVYEKLGRRKTETGAERSHEINALEIDENI